MLAIEVLVALSILTLLVGPRLLTNALLARRAANEIAAVRTLFAIEAAQVQCVASVQIDSDGDGAGEYGYLAELAGVAAVRIPAGDSPGLGERAIDVLAPALLRGDLGALENGIAVAGGYAYRCFLPGDGAAASALAESANGGASAGSLPSANGCERHFAVVCWPVRPGISGGRAFLLTEERLYACDNTGRAGAEPRVPREDDVLALDGWPSGVRFASASGCTWEGL